MVNLRYLDLTFIMHSLTCSSISSHR